MNLAAPIPWHLLHSPQLGLDIVRPSAPSPIVYSLPHSGRYYPASFVAAARPSGSALRASEDAWVDEMVGVTADSGVNLVMCRYARAFCDVNRNPLELDARLIRGELPKAALSLSNRVKAGFGVIARRLSADQDIYRQPIDMPEVNRRLELVHRPYHETLQAMLRDAKSRFGRAVLIDWHSMPSAALVNLSPRPDIVLGNLHGESCGEGLTRRVKSVLEEAGLRVGLNKPFAGGYIIETYGRPATGIEALQIEINRARYMNEASLEPLPDLERLKAVFSSLTEALRDGW